MESNNTAFENLLKEKWKKIQDSNPERLSQTKKLNLDSVSDSIEKILKLINERKIELNSEFSNDYEIEEKLFALIILEHTYVFNILDKYFGMRSNKKESHSLLISTILMHQMNNSIIAFFKLLNDGFSFQANLIFRSVFEQGSTILAIMLDDKFLEDFKENSNILDSKQKVKHWHKNLSPKKIDSILLEGFEKTEGFSDFKNLYSEFKEYIYSDSSEFVHSQFLPSILSSYTSKKGDDDNLDMNIFGRIDSNIDRLLIRSLPYFTVFFSCIAHILILRYDFRFGKYDQEEGFKIWVINNLRSELVAEYISTKKPAKNI